MQTFSIPICYFPTTVLFVDDGDDALNQVAQHLDQDLAYRMLPSPDAAIRTVQAKQGEIEQLSQRGVVSDEATDKPQTFEMNETLNWAAIHAEVYNPQRFNEVAVIVLDQATRGMSGLDCCHKMNNTSIKKLLLIDASDEAMAIQAYKEGIIDHYLLKHQADLLYLIRDSIHHLQQLYFQSMSTTIARMLKLPLPACLNDQRFATFFKQLREDNSIVEFYVADGSGSMLLLNEAGQVSCLVLKNAQELQAYSELAKRYHAPSELIDSLKNGRKIPAFSQPDGLSAEWSDWATCLLPAKKVLCEQVYYYTYVAGDTLFNVRQDKLFSYQRYLESMAPKEVLEL